MKMDEWMGHDTCLAFVFLVLLFCSDNMLVRLRLWVWAFSGSVGIDCYDGLMLGCL